MMNHEQSGNWLRPRVLLLACMLAALPACKKKKKDAEPGVGWYRVELLTEDSNPHVFQLGIPVPIKEKGEVILANGDSQLRMPFECNVRGAYDADCSAGFDYYNSSLEFNIFSKESITGVWERDPYLHLPSLEIQGVAIPGPEVMHRIPESEPASVQIGGEWRVAFDRVPGKAILKQNPDGTIEGTFIPAGVGDTTLLVGRVMGRRVVMTNFNGQNSYMAELLVDRDGSRFEGVLSAIQAQRQQMVGTQEKSPSLLEDMYSAKLSSPDKRITLPLLDKLRGKPVIVDMYGTWCPTCADLVPVLKDLRKKHAESDLQILSIAFEFTEDMKEARSRVNAFHREYGVDWPSEIFLGDIEKSLPPEIERKGFPITLFVNRDGTVHALNTGFVSQSSPEDHRLLVQAFQRWTEDIVASPEPGEEPSTAVEGVDAGAIDASADAATKI